MTNPQEQAEGVKPVEVEPGTLNEVLAVLAAIPVSEYPGKNWEARRNTAIRCLTAVGEALNRLTHQPDTAAQPVGDVERLDGLRQERELGLLYNYTDDNSRQFTRWQMMSAIAHGWRIRGEAALSQHPDPEPQPQTSDQAVLERGDELP